MAILEQKLIRLSELSQREIEEVFDRIKTVNMEKYPYTAVLLDGQFNPCFIKGCSTLEQAYYTLKENACRENTYAFVNCNQAIVSGYRVLPGNVSLPPRKLHIEVLDVVRSFDEWTDTAAIAKRAELHELDCAILLDYWRDKEVFWYRANEKKNTTEFLRK